MKKCCSRLLPLKADRATASGKQKKKRLFTAPLHTVTRAGWLDSYLLILIRSIVSELLIGKKSPGKKSCTHVIFEKSESHKKDFFFIISGISHLFFTNHRLVGIYEYVSLYCAHCVLSSCESWVHEQLYSLVSPTDK